MILGKRGGRKAGFGFSRRPAVLDAKRQLLEATQLSVATSAVLVMRAEERVGTAETYDPKLPRGHGARARLEERAMATKHVLDVAPVCFGDASERRVEKRELGQSGPAHTPWGKTTAALERLEKLEHGKGHPSGGCASAPLERRHRRCSWAEGLSAWIERPARRSAEGSKGDTRN
jgi:hypothetical protein